MPDTLRCVNAHVMLNSYLMQCLQYLPIEIHHKLKVDLTLWSDQSQHHLDLNESSTTSTDGI